MKKFVKLLSATLAVLMLVTVLPISAVAKTLTSFTTVDPSTLTPVLTLDNISDSKTENGVTVNQPYTYQATIAHEATAKDKILYGVDSNKQWAGWLSTTNLQLGSDKSYFVTFDANFTKALNKGYDLSHVQFIFSGTDFSNHLSVTRQYASGKNVYMTPVKGKAWHSESQNGTIVNADANDDFKVNSDVPYVLSVDGMDVALYVDGVKVYSTTLTQNYAENDTLSIGLRVRYYGNVISKDDTIATVSNIKIYEGAYEQITNNYKDGDILMQMATPFTTDFDPKFEDITVEKIAFQNVVAGTTDTNTIYYNHDTVKSGFTFAGVKTNLPLNNEAKYTIEFYAKKLIDGDNFRFGFAWSVNSWEKTQGIYTYENSIDSLYGYAGGISAYGSVGSCSKLWTKYADNDGYTRYTIEINGKEATVYVGGVLVGTMNVGSPALDKYGESATVPNEYVDSYLSLAFKGRGTGDIFDKGDALASIKDLTVYAGNIRTNANIQFEKDGESIGGGFYAPNTVIENFPSVEVEEGKLLKWFYKGTNIIVNTPYTVTHDAIIEARVIDPYDIRVAGAQYTDVVDGKQSVRFVSTIHSLQASEVGFNIHAVYKETAEGTIKNDKEWQKKSTFVYTSITATSNGTVESVTAEELGGTYLIALAVDNVPNYAQIDFYVESYIMVNGVKKTSEVIRFTMSNGEANTELSALAVPNS